MPSRQSAPIRDNSRNPQAIPGLSYALIAALQLAKAQCGADFRKIRSFWLIECQRAVGTVASNTGVKQLQRTRHMSQSQIRVLLSRFATSSRGSVAPMLAIAAIPLIGSVGAAVDYTRASSARTAFQSALDATALMLSKNATTLTGAQLQESSLAHVNALFSRPDTSNVTVTTNYTTTNGSKIVLSGTATVGTTFAGILGVSQINLSAASTVTWGNTRLRVALVLDNTGSMSQSGKMTALKTASHNLLSQIKSAAMADGDAYVSIVPFNKNVNADPASYQQSWLRWDLWEAANGTCSNTNYTNQSSCVSHGKIWTPATHATWNGCVTDRDQNFDTLNTEPVSGATLFPAEQYGSCPEKLMGLSYDWIALNDKIDAMIPAGNTNQAIGLQWGWQSLTAAPFDVPATDPNYQYKQVIILLTDGLNTQDRWYTNQTSIDTRQQKTCDNIKATGITLYTVQVNTGGDPDSAMLKNCASDPGKFFLLTSASQIITTFAEIGTALSNLRVTQ